MNWELFRRQDGTIDLVNAFNYKYGVDLPNKNTAIFYLRRVEDEQRVTTKQAASIILTMAYYIGE